AGRDGAGSRPGGIVAVGVSIAAPEGPSATARSLGHHGAHPALGARSELLGWRRCVLLDVSTVRIPVAANEGAVSATSCHQMALPAQRADLADSRHVRRSLRLLTGQRHRVLAFGIRAASEEPAVAAEALDHEVARNRAHDVGELDLLGDL